MSAEIYADDTLLRAYVKELQKAQDGPEEDHFRRRASLRETSPDLRNLRQQLIQSYDPKVLPPYLAELLKAGSAASLATTSSLERLHKAHSVRQEAKALLNEQLASVQLSVDVVRVLLQDAPLIVVELQVPGYFVNESPRDANPMENLFKQGSETSVSAIVRLLDARGLSTVPNAPHRHDWKPDFTAIAEEIMAAKNDVRLATWEARATLPRLLDHLDNGDRAFVASLTPSRTDNFVLGI